MVDYGGWCGNCGRPMRETGLVWGFLLADVDETGNGAEKMGLRGFVTVRP